MESGLRKIVQGKPEKPPRIYKRHINPKNFLNGKKISEVNLEKM